ncbi:helix-turn-helix domain-containing protein [Salmonella enterica]|nr:helix-turn-helix domain-containing protein [Salmonella enterica]
MQPLINIQPVLINRERVQEMLGGISRTTFYRKRKQWEQTGTPFPKEVTELHPPKGGALFRYVEFIQFCKDKGLIADAQSSTF